jgi:hypothetical protein
MRRPAIAMAVLVLSLGASAVTAQSATPPRPPSAYTGYAPVVSSSSATLDAKINPHGVATEYHFEYGTSTAYGIQTPPAAAGAGTQESQLTETIAGLQAYTVYHYRVVATSAAGTTDGQDATFKTKKIPLSLALRSEPNPMVFGSPLTVAGTLSGTGNASVEVALQGNPFPYTHGFHDLTSPEPTSAAGAFSLAVAGVLTSTELRAATVTPPIVYSPIATEVVTAHVVLHVRPAHRRGFVRLYGTVAPAEPGAAVAFELRTQAHRYVAVSGTVIHGGTAGGVSQFARTVRLRHRGVYRALVEVPNGPQTSGRSQPVVVR